MKIRVGYELIYDFPQPTPMIMVLGTHFTRASDVITPDYLTTSPSVPISPYRDVFGNWCSRIVAPPGRMRLSANGVVRDSMDGDKDGIGCDERVQSEEIEGGGAIDEDVGVVVADFLGSLAEAEFAFGKVDEFEVRSD